MTRMTRELPDKTLPAIAPHATSLISWERPLGTHWLPERPFPFFKESGESPSECKAGSGRFGVIRVIVVPSAAA